MKVLNFTPAIFGIRSICARSVVKQPGKLVSSFPVREKSGILIKNASNQENGRDFFHIHLPKRESGWGSDSLLLFYNQMTHSLKDNDWLHIWWLFVV